MKGRAIHPPTKGGGQGGGLKGGVDGFREGLHEAATRLKRARRCDGLSGGTLLGFFPLDFKAMARAAIRRR